LRIEREELVPWGAVTTCDEIGALRTILTVLGSGTGERVAVKLTGEPLFRVGNALRYWRESKGDGENLRLLEQYIADARAGLLRDRTITLLDEGMLHIVDGTKRAIAIYETSRDRRAEVPVFLLRPPTR
jgi:hypothetical protein